MVSEFEKNYRGYKPHYEDAEDDKFFEVKEYDSLQIAEMKFLWILTGFGIGCLFGGASLLYYFLR